MSEENKPRRKPKGGYRPNAGRKSRIEENKMIEKLDEYINVSDAIKFLRKEIRKGNMKAISLYMAYRFGKPVERKEIDIESRNVDLRIFKSYDELQESKGNLDWEDAEEIDDNDGD